MSIPICEKLEDEAGALQRAAWSRPDGGADACIASNLAAEAAAIIRDLVDKVAEEREENLWNAYNSGAVRDGRWTHMFMSSGEWLARECGFDSREADYPDDEIRAAIPKAARAGALSRAQVQP